MCIYLSEDPLLSERVFVGDGHERPEAHAPALHAVHAHSPALVGAARRDPEEVVLLHQDVEPDLVPDVQRLTIPAACGFNPSPSRKSTRTRRHRDDQIIIFRRLKV